jgi:hypothetical protein
MRFTVISEPLFNIDKINFTLIAGPENISTIQEQPFTVYQNQNRELVINFNMDISVKWIHIYNMTGSLIYSIQYPERNTRISSAGIPDGIYLLQALTNNGKYSSKISVD